MKKSAHAKEHLLLFRLLPVRAGYLVAFLRPTANLCVDMLCRDSDLFQSTSRVPRRRFERLCLAGGTGLEKRKTEIEKNKTWKKQ